MGEYTVQDVASKIDHAVLKPEMTEQDVRDHAAMCNAEDTAKTLVDRWLLWFQAESAALPHVTRIDFLVVHSGPGQAAVWTVEVGECGASLCSIEVHARNTAALNRAILGDPSGRFPVALPADLPRNNGWKS